MIELKANKVFINKDQISHVRIKKLAKLDDRVYYEGHITMSDGAMFVEPADGPNDKQLKALIK